MEALFFLIPLALLFCILTVKAFFWAVAHRQFENLDSAARSILFDDDVVAAEPTRLPAEPTLLSPTAESKPDRDRKDSHAA